jgi:peptidoglycan/LPS O-acetylase OafA/YrhL
MREPLDWTFMRKRLSTALGSEKYPALTGVRAVGATAVFFDHFPPFPDQHIVINVMAFFYALSGFLIVRVYQEQLQLNRDWLAKYFVNRFARIYPVYFVLLTVAVLATHTQGTWTLFANYTLMHALFPGTHMVIGPSWSLTVEETFYVLAPVFMYLAKRYRFLVPFALAALLLIVALAFSRLHTPLLGNATFVLSTTFFGHFAEFFAGFALALAVLKVEQRGPLRLPGARFTLAGFCGVALVVAAMMVAYRQHMSGAHLSASIVMLNNFLIPLPIMLLYWGLLREETLLSRFLSGKVLGLLGRSSYSFYLLHMLIVGALGAPLAEQRPEMRVAVVLGIFLLTWLLSVALYLFFEEPVNLRIRRVFKSKSMSLQNTLFPVKSATAETGNAAAPDAEVAGEVQGQATQWVSRDGSPPEERSSPGHPPPLTR